MARSDDPGIEPHERTGFEDIKGFPLGHSVADIEKDDVGQTIFDDLLGCGRTDISGTDDADLSSLLDYPHTTLLLPSRNLSPAAQKSPLCDLTGRSGRGKKGHKAVIPRLS